VPLGHGRAKAFPVFGSQLPKQLVHREADTTVTWRRSPSPRRRPQE
jgi:hypothetical protein